MVVRVKTDRIVGYHGSQKHKLSSRIKIQDHKAVICSNEQSKWLEGPVRVAIKGQSKLTKENSQSGQKGQSKLPQRILSYVLMQRLEEEDELLQAPRFKLQVAGSSL
ncbi:hypothetical protein Taro_046008 [Colocasia esculenta]|uniref:Uncharacterized protein n=1 Tax=Colocasia esculenta TaxID=4460 RepID=A0A843WNM5_COLES|nr:hypothetical protein [Colocasia esculenta]